MKVLFVASEGLPYSKTGGLADVVGALPQALVEAGHAIAVLLPRYHSNKTLPPIIPSLTIPLGDELRYPAIAEGAAVGGVRYFFVDDPAYFDRDQLYGIKGSDYPDNAERFAEFSRAAIEFTKQVWMPDVIHCHDWQTSLVPVFLRSVYAQDPALRKMAVVLTIHNIGYPGVFPRSVLERTGLPANLFNLEALEYYGKVNFLKGGIIFSDAITTVSRKYAKEIQTPEYGFGLEGVIRQRADRLTGIVNGVDYAVWSPEADKLIAQNYSSQNLDGKKACKKDLLEVYKLPAANLEKPLIGIVSRFDEQKGFDLIAEIAGDLLQENISLVVLGTGKPEYEKLFQMLAAKFPAKAAAKIAYDNTVAHKIEAGADMFLMPSRYEPCGLNQIYSLRYGTVPIVRATGGLDDTIIPFNLETGGGTGFKFEPYKSKPLLACIREALKVFRDQKAWRKLQLNGMAKDFSWRPSAAAYVDVYEAARGARIPSAVVSSN
jgi:starch synthase